MARTHDRDFFYKYVTADTAEKILENGKLLWSAPHLFNDPFDHQVTYRFPFSAEDVVKKHCEIFERIAFGQDEPQIVATTELGQLALAVRSNQVEGDKKRNALELVKQAAIENIGRMDLSRRSLNEIFVRELADCRVLCVSEQNDNVVMWSHYAEKHSGAIIKLNCVEAADSSLLIAKKITYTDSFPNFISVDEWVEGTFGLSLTDYAKLSLELPYLKHKDWSYENEWRVRFPRFARDADDGGRSFYKMAAPEFGAIYLGCRMLPKIKQKLVHLTRRKYPRAAIFLARQSTECFSLEFEPIEPERPLPSHLIRNIPAES